MIDVVTKARRILEMQPKIDAILESKAELSPEQAEVLKEAVDLANGFERDLVRTPNIVTNDPEVRRIIECLVKARAWEIETTCGLVDELEKDAYRDDFWADDYTARMLTLPVTFTNEELPKKLAELMEEARRCFASRHFTASVALCRTILEKAVTELGIKQRKILRPTVADYFAQYPPNTRFDMVLGEHSKARRAVRDFYRYASRVIHGATVAKEEDARKEVGSALMLVTEILDQYG